MKSYIITAIGYTGTMTAEYDGDGALIALTWSDDCDWNFAQRNAAKALTPGSDTFVGQTFKDAKRQDGGRAFEVVEAERVPTFDDLWRDYPADSSFKGSKQDALKSWNKLSDPKRIAAHSGLKGYKRDLKTTGQYPKHVATYLNSYR